MKKIIILAILFCFVASPIHAMTLQEQYISTLQQLISVLQQEIARLTLQLNSPVIIPPIQPVVELTNPTPSIQYVPIFIPVPQPVTQPVQPVTPISPTQPTPTPTFGTIEPSPIVLTVDIVGICNFGDKVNPLLNAYQVYARYIENGKKKLDVPITISSPESDGFFAISGNANIQTEHSVIRPTLPIYNGFQPSGDAYGAIPYCSTKSSGITFTASTNGTATTSITTGYMQVQ